MFVTVVVKKASRLKSTHKFEGGVLNPEAVHGKGYYVCRIVDQDLTHMLERLGTIKRKRQTLMLSGEVSAHEQNMG